MGFGTVSRVCVIHSKPRHGKMGGAGRVRFRSS